MVVVFMPPAVEPDEPPISIKIIISILLAWLMRFKSMVLNPAVRADMALEERCQQAIATAQCLAAPLHSGQKEKIKKRRNGHQQKRTDNHNFCM